MKKVFSFVVLALFLFSQKPVHGQITIVRLVHGGNRSEMIQIYSDKEEMNKVRKQKLAGNEHSNFYLVRPSTLRSITIYINSNCKSSKNKGETHDDVYFIATGLKNKTQYNLTDKSGKDFLIQLKNWILHSSFSKECEKIAASLQGTMVDSF
jgi:hypothetical protein